MRVIHKSCKLTLKIKKMIAAAVLTVVGLYVPTYIHKKRKRIHDAADQAKYHVPYGPYESMVKRPLDIAISVMALIFLSPVMGITAVLVRLKLGSPVVFKQQRPGLDEKVFTIYKFRTMTEEKDVDGSLLPDGQRLTKFGKRLRASSLDELPELFNILKGDMGVVGPRPLLVEYLPRYNERQKRRHDVRPGLTGLAQASGRNALTWEEKFEDDLKYVNKITFLGDMKILLDTVKVVLKKEGIDETGQATVENFMGNHT